MLKYSSWVNIVIVLNTNARPCRLLIGRSFGAART